VTIGLVKKGDTPIMVKISAEELEITVVIR